MTSFSKIPAARLGAKNAARDQRPRRGPAGYFVGRGCGIARVMGVASAARRTALRFVDSVAVVSSGPSGAEGTGGNSMLGVRRKAMPVGAVDLGDGAVLVEKRSPVGCSDTGRGLRL